MSTRYPGAREAEGIVLPVREPTSIRYVGGPLHRSTRTTRQLPHYRDSDGLPVSYRRGLDLVFASQQLGGVMPSLYVLGRDKRTYEYLPDLHTQVRTHRIKALVERAKQHPEFAHEIDKQIRALEDAAR